MDNFKVIRRHIITVAMNPNSIIKCFNILKNQLVGVLVVNDVESVEPFSFN